MRRPTRRAVLAATPVLATAFAGCSSPSASGSTPGSTASNSTPTPASETPQLPADRFSVDGSVSARATADHPLRVQFRTTNRGDRPLTVRSDGNRPMTLIGRIEGPSGTVVLVPRRTEDVSSDAASSRTDGCWRFRTPSGEAATLQAQPILRATTLDPGETYSVEHDVYYAGPVETCFAPGEYRTTARFVLGAADAEGPALSVGHALVVESDGTPSVTVDEPTPL